MGHQDIVRLHTPTVIHVGTNKVHPETIEPQTSLFRIPSTKVQLKNVSFLRKLFSVRILLLGSFIFQVLFMAGITLGTTTYSQKETTTDLSSKILDNVVLRVSDRAKNIFEYPWELTHATYEHVISAPELTYELIQPILWRQFKLGRNKVICLYVSFTNGDSYGYYHGDLEIYVNKTENIDGYLMPVVDQKIGRGNMSDLATREVLVKYDMRTLQWWNPISQSKTPIWSEVYLDASFPTDLFYTSLFPIFDANGQFIATVGIDITSRSLRDFLSNITISKHAVIWMMEPESGVLVACSDRTERTYQNENPGITYAFDSNLKLVRETSKRIMARYDSIKNGMFQFNSGGEDIVAHVSEMNDHSLKLYVLVAYPASDFLGSVTRMQTLILSVSAVAFVVSLIVGIWVMFLVTSPLAKLGRQMDDISNGNFENHALTKAPSSTKLYEIYSLQMEFQRMVTALRSFGRFVPVDIVRHLLRNNTEAVASVSQKDLTVMFSDIKGFTHKVEEMSPQQLSLLLSDYLSAMCAIIGENDGTVDKFIGDAIMALWNVPTQVKHHPVKACMTALESVKALKQLNVKWMSNGLPDIQCRIGIHTGRALVGNLGSNERLSYTAVGDSVNLASRLEALNKRYETSILISGEVYEQVKHVFLCRYLDIVVVQGRTQATKLYELVEEREKASSRDIDIANLQNEAVVAFFERRFADSLQHLIVLREMLPHDISVISLSERATEGWKNHDDLPHDWTGYYVLNEK